MCDHSHACYDAKMEVSQESGSVVAYFWLERTQELLPFVLAVAAASFVYVAVADLIPGLHRRVDGRASLFQILLIGGGVGVIYLTRLAVP